jgi:hypothetical protein
MKCWASVGAAARYGVECSLPLSPIALLRTTVIALEAAAGLGVAIAGKSLVAEEIVAADQATNGLASLSSPPR